MKKKFIQKVVTIAIAKELISPEVEVSETVDLLMEEIAENNLNYILGKLLNISDEIDGMRDMSKITVKVNGQERETTYDDVIDLIITKLEEVSQEIEDLLEE